MGAPGKHKDGRQHCTSCRSRYSRTVRKTRSGGASRNPRRYRRRTPDRGHVRAGSRGQVMGRQFGLAFDEIGTSLRRQYGSSPDSLLEQSGFEPLVPLEKDRLSAALISRSDQRQLPKATVGLIVRIRFAPAKSPRRTAPAVGAGTPLRKGGTDGSNPVPSSGESGQLQLRDWQP